MPKAKEINDVLVYIKENNLSFSLTGNSEIVDNSKLFEIQCLTCNTIFKKAFYKFSKEKTKCPVCSKKTRQQSLIENGNKKFNNFYKTISNKFELLSPYYGDKKKIHVRCKICNNDSWPLPYNLKQGSGCIYCGRQSTRLSHIERMKQKTKNIEIVRQEVSAVVGNEYTVDGEYVNNKTLLTFTHHCEKCNNFKFKMSSNNFLVNKHRCPMCNESKGEKEIYNWLTENNISFSQQYKFDDCKNVYPLKFDFAIFNSEKNLKLLIEFNGIQHYRPVKAFGGEEGFKKQVENDNIKYNYCNKNSIRLLIIPYTQLKSIGKILEREI